jgi:IclR family acetate operon transcriptional repressor
MAAARKPKPAPASPRPAKEAKTRRGAVVSNDELSTVSAQLEQKEAQGTVQVEDKEERRSDDSSGTPQLLERTFAVLELFASGPTEWTTMEISNRSGLPVPTAHRILLALNRHAFLVRDPASKRFRLGPAAIALGRSALSSNDMLTVAGRLLPQLTARTEETSLLTLPTDERDASICLLRVESPHPLRLSVQPGRVLPLHAGANQKALLSFLPPADRERVAGGSLEKFCRLTLSTRKAVLAEIEQIRGRGWAFSFEETNPGVWGVAIALVDQAGDAVAAVGVAGPQVRFSRSVLEKAVRVTGDTAAELASALGLTSTLTSTIVVPDDLIPADALRT